MNNEGENTTFLAGDFNSENAVRGALQRRPRDLPTRTDDTRRSHPTDRPAGADDAPAPRSRSGRLRRWSVAELIAGAVTRPPTGGIAH